MNLYKELIAYQRSYALALSLYKFTKTLPNSERYGLTSQITRSATSIPLNIAEGYGKEDSAKETARFLRMSKGSCQELSVLINFCKDLNYMSDEAFEKYSKEIDEISAMLYTLNSKLL